MTHREEFIKKYPTMMNGMHVRSADGEDLGEITELGEDYFAIKKGFFFPKEFTGRYSDITDVRGGDAILTRNRADLEPWKDAKYAGWSEYDRHPDATREGITHEGAPAGYQEEVRVPVIEEELDVKKNVRDADQVRLRKVVHTELKHLTVPVKKEELRVERVPATGGAGTQPGAAIGKENETVVVSAKEEVPEIVKRPVVKEEVRVTKETHVEKRDIAAEVRKQDVEVERGGKTTEPPKRKAG